MKMGETLDCIFETTYNIMPMNIHYFTLAVRLSASGSFFTLYMNVDRPSGRFHLFSC